MMTAPRREARRRSRPAGCARPARRRGAVESRRAPASAASPAAATGVVAVAAVAPRPAPGRRDGVGGLGRDPAPASRRGRVGAAVGRRPESRARGPLGGRCGACRRDPAGAGDARPEVRACSPGSSGRRGPDGPGGSVVMRSGHRRGSAQTSSSSVSLAWTASSTVRCSARSACPARSRRGARRPRRTRRP